jgi:hypothetical protein
MKKISIIQEGQNLGKLTISDSEFRNYISTINNILKSELYSDRIENVEGISLIKALPYEVSEGRYFSTLNKVNTNILLLKKMITMFNLNSFNDIISFVTSNKVDLFTESGKHFKSLVYTTIRQTEIVGEENEEFVCQYLKHLAKKKFDQDIEPVREVTSSYKDLILGIDITFPINGNDYTCQVKPLVSAEQNENTITVTSSGRLKLYKTDYIAFVNRNQNSILLFKNRGVKLDGDRVSIDKNNLVNI